MADDAPDSDDDAQTKGKKQQVKELKAKGVSAAEIDDLEHVFEHYDPDANGLITTEDVRKLLTKLGHRLNDRDLAVIFRRLTHGQSTKQMNMTQFCLMLHNMQGATDEPLKAYFTTVLDADGSGELNPKELKKVMKRIGEKVSREECKEMIREVNSEKEFIELCTLRGKNRHIDW